MKKQRIYCCYCGENISQKEVDGKIRDYCTHCNTMYYENPLPVASNIVVNERREVLLVKRKNEPYKDMWCLPIGFAETGEEIHEAALRELREETGIDGEIIRLIDVDTVDNYFYGSLAIITYEVRKIGGEVIPGDDATEARYFPLGNLPKLAWSSNEKAIKIYIKLYQDTWAMIDSFRQMFPEMETLNDISQVSAKQKQLLSNVLVKILETGIDDITTQWAEKVLKSIPELLSYHDILIETNKRVIRGVKDHLLGDIHRCDFNEFFTTGRALAKNGVPVPELVTALALSRKYIWLHVVKKKFLETPLEIYATLELNNRIIFLYDKIIYFILKGFGESEEGVCIVNDIIG